MPKIINLIKVKTDNLVELEVVDFIELLDHFKSNTIFKDDDCYYVMKEGFCYFMYHNNAFDSFEELFKKAKEIKAAGFNNIDLYESSKSFGKFENQDDYITFSDGGFFPHFDAYVESKKGGFSNHDDYKEAKLLGIKFYEELIEFKESEFYNDDYASRMFQFDVFTQKHRDLNIAKYLEFLHSREKKLKE